MPDSAIQYNTLLINLKRSHGRHVVTCSRISEQQPSRLPLAAKLSTEFHECSRTRAGSLQAHITADVLLPAEYGKKATKRLTNRFTAPWSKS